MNTNLQALAFIFVASVSAVIGAYVGKTSTEATHRQAVDGHGEQMPAALTGSVATMPDIQFYEMRDRYCIRSRLVTTSDGNTWSDQWDERPGTPSAIAEKFCISSITYAALRAQAGHRQ